MGRYSTHNPLDYPHDIETHLSHKGISRFQYFFEANAFLGSLAKGTKRQKKNRAVEFTRKYLSPFRFAINSIQTQLNQQLEDDI